jgi:hypothetical protein
MKPPSPEDISCPSKFHATVDTPPLHLVLQASGTIQEKKSTENWFGTNDIIQENPKGFPNSPEEEQGNTRLSSEAAWSTDDCPGLAPDDLSICSL